MDPPAAQSERLGTTTSTSSRTSESQVYDLGSPGVGGPFHPPREYMLLHFEEIWCYDHRMACDANFCAIVSGRKDLSTSTDRTVRRQGPGR